ncbi:MAG: DUF3450 domain-containing protein [Desulfobulbaceae bacterium]|jgi:vacuolar-type H+-ATPase subunit I/STV1|nr:DUF3450 domain-containing protein [Desulfobulbaceae bacterium]
MFVRCLGAAVSLLIFLAPVASLAVLDEVKKPVADYIAIRQNTQKEAQKWRDDKDELLSRLTIMEERGKQMAERKTALEERLAAARKRVADKNRQLADIETIRASIAPFLSELTGEIDEFVAADLPFLAEERQSRLQRLKEIESDPKAEVSEKFRKAMETLLVETEYGHTIETYQQTIPLEGRNRLVDVFRLGRLALFFQTVDQKESGFYNMATKSWQKVDNEYNRAISHAMEIGGKRRPVELLALPLGRIGK